MSNNKDDKINAPEFVVTTKGNSGCPTCDAAGAKQCRCRGSGGGGSSDTDTNPQNLESKKDASSPTLSVKLEYQAGLTPQFKKDPLLSTQTIFAQFKKELKPQKVEASEYTAAIIDNELLVKIDAANKSAHNEGNEGEEARTNSFSIPNPYALPKCTPS